MACGDQLSEICCIRHTNRRCTVYPPVMTPRERDYDAVVATSAAEVIARLDGRLPEIAERTQGVLVRDIPELRDDAKLLQLLRDTVAANIETVFAAIRNDIALENLEPPTTALEYARRLAQRGVPANVLVRAYRIGHQAVLDVMINEMRNCSLEPRPMLDVIELITEVTFRYIDWISQQVISTYQIERDRWHEDRSYVRASRVRELLAGGEVDIDEMTKAIRYPLRRVHMAVIAWWPEPNDCASPASIEQFVNRLTETMEDHERSLFIPVDRLTGWAWIPLTAETASTAPAHIRAIVDSMPDAPHVVAGRPLSGLEGFRRSHQQALDTQAVAHTSGSQTHRLIEADEPGVLLTSLLSGDIAAAQRWTVDVLGPLACATDADKRLRDTLRVFLRTGSSFKAASDELHLHFNTVRYRVGRAVERRGREIGDDRLDVEVALLLCHLLGDAVLE